MENRNVSGVRARETGNKLAEKKKAERRDRNIAEFGEGARARKMYENDTDEEDDEEDKHTEPNPKLSQGNDLPR